MVAAGLVLRLSSPKLAKAAFIQLTAPALGIILGLFVLTPW
jgi:putative membrane protein